MVAGLSVVSGVNMSLGGVNFGSFIAPMSRDLRFDTTLFGLASAARSLATAFFSPQLGKLLDARGSRIPLAIAGVAAAAILCGMALINAGWQMIVLMALIGGIGMQGGVSLYSAVPITRWFVRKRGHALSMAFVGGPIALLLTLPGTPWLIDQVGWRAAWAIIGIAGGLTVTLVALLLVHDRPEEMGLLPDGMTTAALEEEKAAIASGALTSSVLDEYPWTREEALRTRSFWLLGIAFGIANLGTGAFVLFRIPYFIEKGISPTLSGAGAASDALIVAIGTFFIGLWIDRMSLRHAGALGSLLNLVSFIIALVADNIALMFLANLVFGLGQVFNSAVRNLIWPAYFGRAHAGAIRGAAFTVQMVFGTIGAPLAGVLRDLTGTYTLAWIIFMIPSAIGMIMILFAHPPRPAAQPRREQPTVVS